jgi:predicted dehydrogenase
MKLVVLGCGNIAAPYCKDIKRHANLEIIGFYDLDGSRAQKLAAEHGGEVFATLKDALASGADVVVNLTIHHAHHTVIKAALEAGKHVYTEKPLAMTYAEAAELVALAAARGLRLACAPIGFLGEAQQTAMALVRGGRLGRTRLAYAEVNHGRIESWHPAPQAFYAVGPLFDVGVYPLTILTALWGAASSVTAFARTVHPERVTKTGEPFTVNAPDYWVINLEWASGEVARVTANFYVAHNSQQAEGLEFHGDVGSLFLKHWFSRDAQLEYADFGKSYAPVPLLETPPNGLDWALGLVDMAHALQTGTAPRVTGAQAAHVVEIIEAAGRSAGGEGTVKLESTFEPPAPLGWARIEPTP